MQNDSGSPLEPVALATSVCQVSEQPGRRIWCPGLELLPDSLDPYSLDPLVACDSCQVPNDSMSVSNNGAHHLSRGKLDHISRRA